MVTPPYAGEAFLLNRPSRVSVVSVSARAVKTRASERAVEGAPRVSVDTDWYRVASRRSDEEQATILSCVFIVELSRCVSALRRVANDEETRRRVGAMSDFGTAETVASFT